MLAGKTPEEIRKTFNIKNDFTPEEEEQVGLIVVSGRVVVVGGRVVVGRWIVVGGRSL